MKRVLLSTLVLVAGCAAPPAMKAALDAAEPGAAVPPLRHAPVRAGNFAPTTPLNWPDVNQGVAPQPRGEP